MKKRFLLSSFATLLLTSFVFYSCTKEEPLGSDLDYNLTPELIGEIHNRAMNNFKSNYVNNGDLNSDEEKLTIIKINQDFLNQELIDRGIQINNEIDLSFHKQLLGTEGLADHYFYGSNSYSGKSSSFNELENYNAYQIIDYILDRDYINLKEKYFLNQIIELHKQNYEFLITDIELKNSMIELKKEFYNTKPDLKYFGSIYVASAIELAIQSNEWWEENLSNSTRSSYYSTSKTMLAPWIAADVIGGIGNGFINIISQGFTNEPGETANAGEVAWAMLQGAVTSSVSLWSKIASWF